MKRLRLVLALWLLAPIALYAQAARPADPLPEQLDRIFNKKDYEEKKFGPFQWLDGGKAYTTVEPSPAALGGKDIVRYDSATGTRRVLVSASSLVPTPGSQPLAIDDYSWSPDGKKLLVFTNTKKVWRQNTRGDYWVLDLATGQLRKLGADEPASTLMFAKFSPDGTRVAYVRANDLWVEDLASGADHAADLRRQRRRSSTARPTGSTRRSSASATASAGARTGKTSPSGTSTPAASATSRSSTTPTRSTRSSRASPIPRSAPTNSAVKIGVVAAGGGAPRWVELPGDPREHLRGTHGVRRLLGRGRDPAAEPPPEHQRRLARRSRDRQGPPDAPRRGPRVARRRGRPGSGSRARSSSG